MLRSLPGCTAGYAAAQSRALNYLWAVTEGVLCAMAQLEAAVLRALAFDGGHEKVPRHQQQQQPQPQSQQQDQTAQRQWQRQQRKQGLVEEGGGLAGSCSTPQAGGSAPGIGVGKEAGACTAAGRSAWGRRWVVRAARGARGRTTGRVQLVPEQAGGDIAAARDQGEQQEQQEQRSQPQLDTGRSRECVALEIGGGGGACAAADEGRAAGVRGNAARGARGQWAAAVGAAGRTVRNTWRWQLPLWQVGPGSAAY